MKCKFKKGDKILVQGTIYHVGIIPHGYYVRVHGHSSASLLFFNSRTLPRVAKKGKI